MAKIETLISQLQALQNEAHELRQHHEKTLSLLLARKSSLEHHLHVPSSDVRRFKVPNIVYPIPAQVPTSRRDRKRRAAELKQAVITQISLNRRYRNSSALERTLLIQEINELKEQLHFQRLMSTYGNRGA